MKLTPAILIIASCTLRGLLAPLVAIFLTASSSTLRATWYGENVAFGRTPTAAEKAPLPRW